MGLFDIFQEDKRPAERDWLAAILNVSVVVAPAAGLLFTSLRFSAFPERYSYLVFSYIVFVQYALHIQAVGEGIAFLGPLIIIGSIVGVSHS